MIEPAKLLVRLRKLCRSLDDASEKASWGHPNFQVGGKTFAVFEHYRKRPCVATQQTIPDQLALLADPRFYATPYVGKQGWVSAWVDVEIEWSLLEDLVRRSHALVAASLVKRAARARSRRRSSARPASRKRRDRTGARDRGRRA